MSIIVTRHDGAVEWLESHGISGEVISSLSDERIDELREGDAVYGVLPFHLIVEVLKRGAFVSIIQFTSAPPRGRELTREDMEGIASLHQVKLRGRLSLEKEF